MRHWLLPLLSSLTACTTMQMKVPSELLDRGRQTKLTSYPKLFNQVPIIFAPFEAHKVDIGWTRQTSSDASVGALVKSTRDTVQEFSFTARLAKSKLSAETKCKIRGQTSDSSTKTRLGTFTVSNADRWLYCYFSIGRRDYQFLLEGIQQNAKGMLEFGKEKLNVEPITDGSQGHQTPWALGYRFDKDQKVQAAVQVINDPEFWYLDSADKKQTLAMATAATALIISYKESGNHEQ